MSAEESELSASADLMAALEHSAQLERALTTSRCIGMATGILMERHELTADQAFDRLRLASQRQNVKLHDVAEHLVLTGSLNDW